MTYSKDTQTLLANFKYIVCMSKLIYGREKFIWVATIKRLER